MRLQRSISRRLDGKEYVKHQLVIPNELTSQLGWSGGDRIEGKVTRGGFLLYKTEPREQEKRLSYEEFRRLITDFLASRPEGSTWAEIRAKVNLSQMTPSPIWVRRMEQENNLERHTDTAIAKSIWKLPKQYFEPAKSTLNGWTVKRQVRDMSVFR